jgi:hypothetical protein
MTSWKSTMWGAIGSAELDPNDTSNLSDSFAGDSTSGTYILAAGAYPSPLRTPLTLCFKLCLSSAPQHFEK